MTVVCITLNPALDMTLNVPRLTVGAVNRATKSQVDAAGKGLNVAQILHNLGHDVAVTGFLGQDNTGLFTKLCHARQAINGKRFDNHFILVEGNTRTNIKLVDDVGTTTDINAQGFVVNEADKAKLFEMVQILTKDARAVVIAGSLPTGFELDDFDTLLGLVKHTKLAVDVSGQALSRAIICEPWLIKPNNEELAEAFGVPVDNTHQQIELVQLLGHNIDNIVVSMGDKGVNWFGKANLNALPPKVVVKSTVGAGDTLLAGMVHGLLSQSSDGKVSDEVYQDILATATALAAYAVTIVGFGTPDNEMLNTLKSAVKTSPIKISSTSA